MDTGRGPTRRRVSSSSSPTAPRGPSRLARARQLLSGAREIGIKSAAIIAATASMELDPELTPAGRIVVAEQPLLAPPAAALFATATPLQLLTERLARVRGTNPDPIRRGDPVYRAAAAAAEA